MVGDEPVYGRLKIDDAVEDTPLETAFCQDGEEALDGVDPACRCRREVEGPARMPGQPFDDLWVLVGCVIVEDGMNAFVARNLAFDSVQEPNEFLMTMALHAAPDHLPLQDIEGGEQGGRAVALIIVGHGSGAPLLHRQSWLCAVEGLYLRLLVNTKHYGVGGRIDVKANDVANLRRKLRIIGKLEGFDAMGGKAVHLPNALHRRQADPRNLGHHATGPMGALARRGAQSHGHDTLGRSLRDFGEPRGACFVAQQTIDALGHEALLPPPDGGLAHACRAHDRGCSQPIGRANNNHGPPNMLLRAVAAINDRLQAFTVSRVQLDGHTSSHSLESHVVSAKGIPLRTLMSASIH